MPKYQLTQVTGLLEPGSVHEETVKNSLDTYLHGSLKGKPSYLSRRRCYSTRKGNQTGKPSIVILSMLHGFFAMHLVNIYSAFPNFHL